MRKLKSKRAYIYTIIVLIFYIILYFYLGNLKFGFARNPYSHELMTFLKNIVTQLFPIVLIEIARIFIISKNKRHRIVIVFMTIFLILLQINYSEFFETFGNREKLFKYICGEVIPIIFYNILFNYLILNKIYFFGFIYRIVNKLVLLISPVIPNLDWFATGTINILFVMIVFILFKYKLLKSNTKREKRRTSLERFRYSVTLVFLTSLVCFMLGIFSYQPISIMSNSMKPLYKRGDVVVFKKLDESELENIKVGQILIYNSGNKNIAHRVIDRVEKDNTVFYQTKGDNNDNPDSKLVSTHQILGIYELHVKFIGFPSIWLCEYFDLE